MAIVSAEDSPTGETLVLVTGEKSSTLSVYSLAPMADATWMPTDEPPMEVSYLTESTFSAEPLPPTPETPGRAAVSDLTMGVC